MSKLHGKFKQLGVRAQTARGDVVRSVNEGLGGVKEIKILRRESAFIERFRVALGETLYVQRFMQVIGRAIPMVMEWISVAGLLAVILVLFSMGEASEMVMSTVVVVRRESAAPKRCIEFRSRPLHRITTEFGIS